MTTRIAAHVPTQQHDPDHASSTSAPATARPRAIQVIDDPAVRHTVEQFLAFDLLQPWGVASDDDFTKVFNHLASLSNDYLRKTLDRLDREGKLDPMVDALPDHRLAFEKLFALLESRGLVDPHRPAMKPGTYAVYPPVTFREAPGADLPPSIRRALALHQEVVHADYEARIQAFRADATAPNPRYNRFLSIDKPAPQPSLARTSEEEARFKLGMPPTLRQALSSPIDAVAQAARFVANQADLRLRAQSLEVGESFDVEAQLGVKGTLTVERKEKDKYEVTMSLEALLGHTAGVELELGPVGLEASLGGKGGLTGSVKLQVASPDELQTLLVAVKTRLQLYGVPKDAAQMKAFEDASQFIKAHVTGSTFGLSSEAAFGIGLSLGQASVSAAASLKSLQELETARTPDGRKELTARREFELTRSVEAALSVLTKSGEKVTKLTFERSRIEPVKPGEKDSAAVKLELTDKSGKRSEVRSVTYKVSPEDLPAWQSAILRSDQAALRALMKKAAKEGSDSTRYTDERSFAGLGTSTTRVMKEKSR
ncbi:MAG: hypothetical protein AB1938_02835 [Myxococcota bacterium]